MDLDLWTPIGRRFRESDVSGAVKFLEERLAQANVSRFKGLLGKRFTNEPRAILSAINEFIVAAGSEFDLKAVYLEMNGFDINPDRWFFDFFGFDHYTDDRDDVDWLCEWNPVDWPEVTLTGLESVQADFAWYMNEEMYNDEKFERAEEVAVLLVMCKFVSLIEGALASGARAKPIPVFATAHDFDIVGRFEP